LGLVIARLLAFKSAFLSVLSVCRGLSAGCYLELNNYEGFLQVSAFLQSLHSCATVSTRLIETCSIRKIKKLAF
jgi:hypothetical protein